MTRPDFSRGNRLLEFVTAIDKELRLMRAARQYALATRWICNVIMAPKMSKILFASQEDYSHLPRRFLMRHGVRMAKATDARAIEFTRLLSDNLRILQERHSPPLSNRELAKRAGLADSYVTGVHAAARGGIGRSPTYDNLLALAEALGCDLDALTERNGPDRPNLHKIVAAASAAVDRVVREMDLDPTPDQKGVIVARLAVAMRTFDHLPADLSGYARERAEILLDLIKHADLKSL